MTAALGSKDSESETGSILERQTGWGTGLGFG